jgi:N-acetylglucosaminyl-diphospho-decaprenol L-rhamnosyltransferase
VTADLVTAIVVSYNTADHLAVCLESLAANEVGAVVVVDNGSVDRSAQVAQAAGVHWVPTGANLGYGRAANCGAATPQGRAARYLLVCNPDVELGEGAVRSLETALDDDPSLGAVGPRIRNPNGSLYPSARTFPDMADAIGHGLFGMVAPGNRFTRRYRLLDWDHGAPARVDWVSGACFLARRQAWDAVDGFDPSYFMYMEDVDLFWRMGRAGWAVGYEPAAEVRHEQGVSANQHPYRMLAAHHRSMWRFASRTTVGTKRVALPVIAAGLAARFVVATVEHRVGGSGRPGVKPAGDAEPHLSPSRRGTGREGDDGATGSMGGTTPSSPPRPLA